jgi:hypothetical protein
MAKIPDIYSVRSSEVEPEDEHEKRCAPGVKFESGSCILLDTLIVYAKAYNKKYPDNAIVLHPKFEILNPSNYKKYLLRELQSRIGSSQSAWHKHHIVADIDSTHREKLVKHTFRPSGPKGKFEWLNTHQIDNVMKQYEIKYNEFKFLGTVPIDFDDFERYNIKNLNYQQLVQNGKTKLGVVFNLDKHNQSGSHWVAMYADLKRGQIFYFDSYGTRPEPQVSVLMRRIGKFCQTAMGVQNIVLEWNEQQHQRENSECGVYSINFILRMLRGDNFNDICMSRIPDRKINKCRAVYFANAKV